jgi:hypothetical protein
MSLVPTFKLFMVWWCCLAISDFRHSTWVKPCIRIRWQCDRLTGICFAVNLPPYAISHMVSFKKKLHHKRTFWSSYVHLVSAYVHFILYSVYITRSYGVPFFILLQAKGKKGKFEFELAFVVLFVVVYTHCKLQNIGSFLYALSLLLSPSSRC